MANISLYSSASFYNSSSHLTTNTRIVIVTFDYDRLHQIQTVKKKIYHIRKRDIRAILCAMIPRFAPVDSLNSHLGLNYWQYIQWGDPKASLSDGLASLKSTIPSETTFGWYELICIHEQCEASVKRVWPSRGMVSIRSNFPKPQYA